MKSEQNSYPYRFEVKDYSVSGEVFYLEFDEVLQMYSTTPQPSPEKLPEYYQSEDYISHTDKKRNLLEKVYHIARDVSLKRKLKLVNSYAGDSKHILDFGCGTGDFLKTAKDNGWQVSGIEPDEGAREIANKKVDISVLDSEAFWNLEANQFDVITLWHVLEHLPELDKHINQLQKLLKPNGTLIIAVPNFKSFDAHYYKEHWAAYDVPRHLWHFSKDSILKLFGNQNFKIEKILPMKLDSYYVSLLSEKYKIGKMNPAKAFYIGWLSNLKAKRTNEYSSLIYALKNGKN